MYGWFRRWQEAGLFDVLLRHVAGLCRRARGRSKGPRLCVVDTPSVKCIPVRGPRGYDAAKKVTGRKRVALVDADGTWLAVAVVPADRQDRDCLEALSAGKQAWPSLRVAVMDGAFIAERCKEWCHRHGMRHHVVARDPEQKGFVVLKRRWVVERSFAWLTSWGGLLRDRAGRLDVSTACLACVAVMAGIEALINLGLAHTRLANATCSTIRLKLFQIGALVKVSVRRIKIAMASGCPDQDIFGRAHAALAFAGQ